MNLEERFNLLVKHWKEHCSSAEIQVSSKSDKIKDCGAYRIILQMKYEAFPLIRDLYDKDSSNDFELAIIQGHGLVCLVKEIAGNDFVIPNEIRGRIKEIKEYTKSWLDRNIQNLG